MLEQSGVLQLDIYQNLFTPQQPGIRRFDSVQWRIIRGIWGHCTKAAESPASRSNGPLQDWAADTILVLSPSGREIITGLADVQEKALQ